MIQKVLWIWSRLPGEVCAQFSIVSSKYDSHGSKHQVSEYVTSNFYYNTAAAII